MVRGGVHGLLGRVLVAAAHVEIAFPQMDVAVADAGRGDAHQHLGALRGGVGFLDLLQRLAELDDLVALHGLAPVSCGGSIEHGLSEWQAHIVFGEHRPRGTGRREIVELGALHLRFEAGLRVQLVEERGHPPGETLGLPHARQARCRRRLRTEPSSRFS